MKSPLNDARIMTADMRDVEEMHNFYFTPNGEFILHPMREIEKIPYDKHRLFMHFEAIYSIPTQEAVDFIDDILGDGTAIGIGSGRALWENELGMIATDLKVQEIPEVIEYYKTFDQPIIKYPKTVEHIDANQAAIKYKPDTIFGSYITPRKSALNQMGSMYGPVEEEFSKHCKQYIKIGSESTHGSYTMCKRAHQRIYLPELVTRSERKDSCLFLWMF